MDLSDVRNMDRTSVMVDQTWELREERQNDSWVLVSSSEWVNDSIHLGKDILGERCHNLG